MKRATHVCGEDAMSCSCCRCCCVVAFCRCLQSLGFVRLLCSWCFCLLSCCFVVAVGLRSCCCCFCFVCFVAPMFDLNSNRDNHN